ncbi:segregation/condensation protein A [Clostridium sp.]|jgi:segregation and condensation protein A|uniref:segregation/condensation protein A n=1 Tax=Clostridium sp. TaxID=1506 RepID=UPI002FDECA62
MPLNIKIENFQGPFDLLLHLIKKNKMNIYDIKIHDITEQYIKYINSMKEMDLEITSEFIVIAASLIEIKSRMLLPKPKLEEDNKDREKDPRKQLVDKLLQYKRFKAAAEFFKERALNIGRMYGKMPEIIEVKNKSEDMEEILKGIDIGKLHEVYYKLINLYKSKLNRENTVNENITVDKFKLEDKMEYIIEVLENKRKIGFSRVIENCSFKIERIITFVALLELVKLRNISIMQYKNFGEIYIERVIEYGGES